MADLSEELLAGTPDKVILIGDVGVGKTSIFTQFASGRFEPQNKDAEKQRIWYVNDSEVSITLFDTAGMERHLGTIPHTYFRSAKVLLLVYSIDEVETFDSLTSWVQNAVSAQVSSGQEAIQMALVGNKLDLESARDVSKERVKTFAELNEIGQDMLFEVSAKEDINLQEMFDAIAVKVCPQAATASRNDSKKSKSEGKKKCC